MSLWLLGATVASLLSWRRLSDIFCKGGEKQRNDVLYDTEKWNV